MAYSGKLFRTIVRLPHPLPVYSGQKISLHGPNSETGVSERTFLQFYEGHSDIGQADIQFNSIRDVLKLESLISDDDTPPTTGIQYRYTVVDAITTMPSPAVEVRSHDARNIPTEHDPINRVVSAIALVARAYLLATKYRVHIPSYEDLPEFLPVWTADVETEDWSILDFRRLDWSGSIVLLETLTRSPDWSNPELKDGGDRELEEAAQFFAHQIESGDPLSLSLEWAMRSKYAMNVRGNYYDAVSNSITFVESFAVAIATCLMWEEQFVTPNSITPEYAAQFFQYETRGSVVERVLQPRLGGDWTSRQSPWSAWKSSARPLRHRIVHAGYSPARSEADSAVEKSLSVQSWILDLLSNKLRKFPRTSWITMGQEGLIGRGRWTRFIREFIDEHAGREVNWRTDYIGWHRELMDHVN
ncbi:hypothetical protein OVA21_06995 [Dietzia sp. SL131]|uniref:hypothetical protein n=1 Tax=Dietzia sp. SL131 TaxID=2995149 RepID=UPI00227A2F3C|nr:hypothetical protein [Dietzia sp. SL131]MCY1656953.1 hypothetical protein [Dietzia sp. SL131]